MSKSADYCALHDSVNCGCVISKQGNCTPTCANVGHAWRIKNERGHDNVHCARCYQCLSVRSMLDAYRMVHGGDIIL